MDIQYLNGIDIQYLDGADDMQDSTNRLLAQAIHNEAERRAALSKLTGGITNLNAYKTERVAMGADLYGFKGDGSIADEEKIRQYLVATKEIADNAPSMIGDYQKPKELSNMLGYVLSKWDSAEREEALDRMIESEKALEMLGSINTNVADDKQVLSQESFTDVDIYLYGLQEAKSSFFASIKKSLKPQLTTEAQDIVAANPATEKIRNRIRKSIAQGRGKQSIEQTTNEAFNGVSDDIRCLMNGTDLQYATQDVDPMQAISNYLKRTHRVATTSPAVFESIEDAQQTAKAIEQLLKVWHNPILLNKIIDSVDNETLNGKLKKKLKKAVKSVGKAVKKAASAVKKVAKKVGKAVAKVTKKVWKLVVRFNPLTLLIRAGILGFVRLNMFKVANKCYIGSLTKEVALKKGATADEWEKSNKAYGHLKNAYTKLGGKESKLKSCLEKGNKKKWTGTEYPNDGNAIKSAAKSISAQDDKEAQADSDYDETLKEYKAKGYISDNTVTTDSATVSKQEQVTIIDNERTAKQASKLYETDDATGKVLLTVPKAAKVLVDTAQTSGNFIAATYNGKNGWITKNDLAGLGNCDAESVAVLSMGYIYDSMLNGSLGEVATGTAIASASSVIASIMAKIKNIFSVAQKVTDKVKTVKNTVSKIASTTKKVASVAKDPKTALKQVATKAADKVTNGAMSQVKNAVSTAKNVATTAKATAQNASQAVAQKVAQAKNVATNTATSSAQTTATTQEQQATSSNTTTTSKGREQATPTQTTQPVQATSASNGNVKTAIIVGGIAVAAIGVALALKRK